MLAAPRAPRTTEKRGARAFEKLSGQPRDRRGSQGAFQAKASSCYSNPNQCILLCMYTLFFSSSSSLTSSSKRTGVLVGTVLPLRLR